LTFILLNTILMAVLADRQPSINFGFTKSCPAVFCN
jgi:hypothetical protein